MAYIGKVPADVLIDPMVDSAAITDATIVTADIANDAVTSAKLAANSVDSSELIDGSVDNSHLAGSIAINKTNLTGGTGLTLSTDTLNVDAAQTQITSVGTLTSFRSTGIDDNADALSITIDSSERVGIGCTPAVSNVASALEFADAGKLSWQTAGGANKRAWQITTSQTADGDFQIMSSNSNDNTIDTNRLGISKEGLVTVFGALTANGNVTFNTADSETALTFEDAGTNAMHIRVGSGDEIYFGSNNSWQTRYKTDGNVQTQGNWVYTGNITGLQGWFSKDDTTPVGTPDGETDDLVVGSTDTAHTGIQFFGSGGNHIYFGDAGSSTIGRIDYLHSDNSMKLFTNSALALTLDSSQNATFAGAVSLTQSTGNSYGLDAYHSSGNTSSSAHIIRGDSGSNTKAILEVHEEATRSNLVTDVFLVSSTSSDTELFNVQANGNVGIGQSNNQNPEGALDIRASSANPTTYFRVYSSGSDAPTLFMGKSKTNTIGGHSETGNGDLLARVFFRGINSSNGMEDGAQIIVTQRGSSGGTYVPAEMKFITHSSSGVAGSILLDEAGDTTFSGDANLSVDKKINFGDTSGTTDRMLIRKNDDGSGEINVLSANDLILRTGDTTRLTISSTGLPTFEKSDGSAAWYMTLKNTNASGYGSGIDFWAAWQIDSIKARINGSPSGGGQGGSLRFYTEDTAGNLDEALALEKDQSATFAGDLQLSSDSTAYKAGASNDLQMFHDGSHSYIQHENTGDLKILSARHNGDIQMIVEDSGGTARTALQLTGAGNATFNGDVTVKSSDAYNNIIFEAYHAGVGTNSLALRKSNHASSVIQTVDNQISGMIHFQGVDTNNAFVDSASIIAKQNGSSASGRAPTQLSLSASSASAFHTDQLLLHQGGGVEVHKGDLTIQGSGFGIGINTSSPGAPIEIRQSAFGSDEGLRLNNPNGGETWDFSIGADAGNKLYISNYNVSGPVMVMDNSGKVGIGTSSPTAYLDIHSGGTVDSSAQLRLYSLAGDTYGCGMLLDSTQTSTNAGDKWKIHNAAASAGEQTGALVFYNYTAGNYGPVFDRSGRVGIGTGTASPGAPFHIRYGESNGREPMIILDSPSNAGEDHFISMGSPGTSITLNIGWRNNTNGFCIARNSNDDLQSGEQFQIGPTGVKTFGSGATTFVGDVKTNAGLEVDAALTVLGRGIFGPAAATDYSSGKDLHIGCNTDDYPLHIWNEFDNSTKYGLAIIFATNGADNNNAKYINCYAEAGGAHRFVVYGDGDTVNHDNSYGQYSDERIKDNITDASSQWDDIKAIKVRNFEMKTDIEEYGDGERVQIGVIAQEVESAGMGKLIEHHEPSDFEMENCGIAEDDKVKSMKYSVLYMKAIKALQEAMERIEALENA